MRDSSTWTDMLRLGGITLGPGCDPAALRGASAALGCPLPRELVSLLQAVNGIYDSDAQCQYGWTIEQIATVTPQWWFSGLPADLIAIGDNGCGEPFCVRADGTLPECTVYHWSPISTDLTLLAPSLYAFWSRWLDGTITS